MPSNGQPQLACTLMSLHVARSSSCALSLALRTTRRSSSLSLSEEPMRKRLAPFFRLEPLLLEELLLESESESEELVSPAAHRTAGRGASAGPAGAASTVHLSEGKRVRFYYPVPHQKSSPRRRRRSSSPHPRFPHRWSLPPRTWTPEGSGSAGTRHRQSGSNKTRAACGKGPQQL